MPKKLKSGKGNEKLGVRKRSQNIKKRKMFI
jgi:hypothetical protein